MSSSGLNCYQLYIAIRSHFTSPTYDYFKYNGGTFANRKTYSKRNDKYQFEKLSSKYGKELLGFFVSVFVNESDSWVGDFLSDKYHTQYMEWLKVQQTISRTFKTDVNTISEFMTELDKSLKELLLPDGDKLPIIIRMWQQNYIKLETIIIINRLTSFTQKCDNSHTEWIKISQLITKYDPFCVKCDLNSVASVLKMGTE